MTTLTIPVIHCKILSPLPMQMNVKPNVNKPKDATISLSKSPRPNVCLEKPKVQQSLINQTSFLDQWSVLGDIVLNLAPIIGAMISGTFFKRQLGVVKSLVNRSKDVRHGPSLNLKAIAGWKPKVPTRRKGTMTSFPDQKIVVLKMALITMEVI